MPCRVFRVGVFFDGTGNTKKPDSSKGKMSNIAKLSDMYKEGTFKDNLGKQTVSKMLYTNGVGTYDSDIVDYIHFIDRKYDKGGGGGGAKRIYEMLKNVIALLDKHKYHKSKPNKFTKREIDVFGFSRGAAMARDFVNTFFKTVDNKKEYQDVRFNFIGIFETVGSFGKPGNAINLKPRKEYIGKLDEDYLPEGMQLNDEDFGIRDAEGEIEMLIGYASGKEDLANKISNLKKDSWEEIRVVIAGSYRGHTAYSIHGKKPRDAFFESYNFDLVQGSNGSAKHIYHLTAHDEVRKNFPLTDTKNAGVFNCLIGVHSDIGGGYAPNEVEEFVYPSEHHTEEAAMREAEALSAKLNAKSLGGGWVAVDPAPIHYALDGQMMVAMGSPNVTLYRAKLQKTTNNSLATVGLHLMYESALRFHVPLNPPNEKVPSALQDYYTYCKQSGSSGYRYIDTQEGSKIQTGLSHHPARDPAHLNDHKITTVSIFDKVFHDVPGAGNDANYKDKYGNSVDGRKHPELAVKVERDIYHNNTNNAVKPKSKIEA